jgi:DNA-binding MarR family transcriptional regulator
MAKKQTETMRSAWPLFVTAHAALIERMEAELAAAGLPELAWYDVLWAIERAPGQKLRLHELAHELVFSRSNLTRLVDRIEGAGLVARERAEDDRRGYYALITRAGLAMRKKMWPVYAKAIESYFDRHLTKAENATMRSVMRRVLDAARAET